MRNIYKSKFTANASPVHVSDYMSGKMSGIPSISTNCLINKYCIERMNNGDMVCKHCFAERTASRYEKLRANLTENTELLTSEILNDEDLPRFLYSVNMVRFESFGDLNNWIQAANYINIARINSHVHFALWTKNPWLIAEAIANGYDIPTNLNIVYSSPLLNVRSDMASRYTFIDKTFTVYDKPTIAAENIEINCGGRSCGSCGTCYFDKVITDIREQLK